MAVLRHHNRTLKKRKGRRKKKSNTLNSKWKSKWNTSNKSKIKGGALSAGVAIPLAIAGALFGAAGLASAYQNKNTIARSVKKIFPQTPRHDERHGARTSPPVAPLHVPIHTDEYPYNRDKSTQIVVRFATTEENLIKLNRNEDCINFNDKVYTWWHKASQHINSTELIRHANKLEEQFYEQVRDTPYNEVYKHIPSEIFFSVDLKHIDKFHTSKNLEESKQRNRRLESKSVQNSLIENFKHGNVIMQARFMKVNHIYMKLLEYLAIFSIEITRNYRNHNPNEYVNLMKGRDQYGRPSVHLAVIGWSQTLLDTHTFIDDSLFPEHDNFYATFQPFFQNRSNTTFPQSDIKKVYVRNLTQFHMFILNQFFTGIRFTRQIFDDDLPHGLNKTVWRLVIFGMMDSILTLDSNFDKKRHIIQLYTFLRSRFQGGQQPTPPDIDADVKDIDLSGINSFMAKLWYNSNRHAVDPNQEWTNIQDFMTDIIHHVNQPDIQSPIDKGITDIVPNHDVEFMNILNAMAREIPCRIVYININTVQNDDTYRNTRVHDEEILFTNSREAYSDEIRDKLTVLQTGITSMSSVIHKLFVDEHNTNISLHDTNQGYDNYSIHLIKITALSAKRAEEVIDMLYAAFNENIQLLHNYDQNRSGYAFIIKPTEIIVDLSEDAVRLLTNTKNYLQKSHISKNEKNDNLKLIDDLINLAKEVHVLIKPLLLLARELAIFNFQSIYNIEFIENGEIGAKLQIFVLDYRGNLHYLTPRKELFTMSTYDLYTKMTLMAMSTIDALTNPPDELKTLIGQSPDHYKKVYSPEDQPPAVSNNTKYDRKPEYAGVFPKYSWYGE